MNECNGLCNYMHQHIGSTDTAPYYCQKAWTNIACSKRMPINSHFHSFIPIKGFWVNSLFYLKIFCMNMKKIVVVSVSYRVFVESERIYVLVPQHLDIRPPIGNGGDFCFSFEVLQKKWLRMRWTAKIIKKRLIANKWGKRGSNSFFRNEFVHTFNINWAHKVI